MSRFAEKAVTDSEKIEEAFEDLQARFNIDAPFVFHITMDVLQAVAWKEPYTGIKVRASRDRASY